MSAQQLDMIAFCDAREANMCLKRLFTGRIYKPNNYVGFYYNLYGCYWVETAETSGEMKTETLYQGLDFLCAEWAYNTATRTYYPNNLQDLIV